MIQTTNQLHGAEMDQEMFSSGFSWDTIGYGSSNIFLKNTWYMYIYIGY